MIVPWGTDAPIYHQPVMTVALIVVNALVFVFLPADLYEDWTLVLGEGYHPLQWLTNSFVHAGVYHLAGNLIFLWTFGLVVEGKLGWWAFLLVYLGLGACESAGLQLLVRPETPIHVLGASGVVFGLLAISLVWAPINDVVCIVWLRITPSVFDVSILWFVAGYIALDVLTSSLQGLVMAGVLDRSMSAIVALAFDHTTSAILGFIVGVVLLKLGWVDCENWDIFAVLEGRRGQSKAAAKKAKSRVPVVSLEFQGDRKPKRRPKRKKARAEVTSVEDAGATALRRMRRHLELGEVEAALTIYNKSSRAMAGWNPPEADCVELVQALIGMNAFGDAATVMRDHVQRSVSPSPRIRLKLAQVLIQKLARPLQALTVLGPIPEGVLPASLETVRRRLIQEAEHMREEGDLELQDELW